MGNYGNSVVTSRSYAESPTASDLKSSLLLICIAPQLWSPGFRLGPEAQLLICIPALTGIRMHSHVSDCLL